jgi:hypothetical protein
MPEEPARQHSADVVVHACRTILEAGAISKGVLGMRVSDAVKCVCAAIRKDKGYFISWQANIAMAFVDENRRQGSRDSYRKVHQVANTAAVNFLNLLCKPVRPQSKRSRQSHPTTDKG